ncbi:MAG TPA: alpha/beta fold hydrolase [Candidatus Dormibacteraeota bacterium]|jgi:pimeloyl-ACP methyl ester carboxylesterase
MRARTGDIETAWFEIGRGSPLVLIHGLADDHRLWRKAVPDLALRHRVILYDVRGHGQSTVGDADGTLDQLGADLARLMEAIGLERATVAGFSLGGTIAMRLAIDHPEKVDVLFAVATSSRVSTAAAQWYAERAAMGNSELRTTIDRDTVDAYHISPGELEEGLAIRRQSTQDPAGYRNAAQAMAGLKTSALDPELVKIRARTLIVCADLDQHCPPRAGEIIAAGIPDSTMEIILGSGHMLPAEKPQELAALVIGFLREAATA